MLITYADKIGAAKHLFQQATDLLGNPDATMEQKSGIQKMIEDAKSLQIEASQLKSIEESHKSMSVAISGGKRLALPSGFTSLGEFLGEVWKAGNPSIKAPWHVDLKYVDSKDDAGPEDGKALSGATGASGGFLIPDEFQATLMSVVAETALVRGRATVIPMRRRTVTLPVLDQTGTTAGVPHWFGGMRFYWAEESAEKTETEPAFKAMQLIAHKLIGYTQSSDELLDDSAISLEAFFNGPLGFGGGVAWMEDYAFLNGTGAGQPLGVLPAPATIAVPREAANDIQFVDLARMVEKFLPSGRGVWFASQSAMSRLIQMNGPAGNPSYIWMPNATAGVPSTLFGMPIVWTEKLPALGTKGDILLADWRYYLIGDRQQSTIESTKFDQWKYDKTSWRVVHRVDGRPWLSAPLTLQDGATQVSPFVVLDSTVS